jgi:coatomer subunit gamma
VSREVRSLPPKEKAAPGKRPPAGAAAAAAPVSTVDAYQKMLSFIPEFSGFGRLFKVCILFYLLKFDKYIC